MNWGGGTLWRFQWAGFGTSVWRTNDFGGLNFEAPGVQVVRKWAEVTTCQVLRNSDGKKISFFFLPCQAACGIGD